MKSNSFKVASITLLIAVLAAIGVSQTVKRVHMHREGMWGGGMFDAPMMGFLAHKLNLTDAQRAQVKEIMAKEKPALQPLMLQLAQDHHQMRELVMSTGFDEAKVREIASQQTQAMTELTVQRARVEAELLQVLTSDQKSALTTILSQHEQRLIDHMQRPVSGQVQSQ
jgi:periplasmic protein CpxP/Spy